MGYRVPTWMFAIFNMETAGMKTCSRERMFRLDCDVDNKKIKAEDVQVNIDYLEGFDKTII